MYGCCPGSSDGGGGVSAGADGLVGASAGCGAFPWGRGWGVAEGSSAEHLESGKKYTGFKTSDLTARPQAPL